MAKASSKKAKLDLEEWFRYSKQYRSIVSTSSTTSGKERKGQETMSMGDRVDTTQDKDLRDTPMASVSGNKDSGVPGIPTEMVFRRLCLGHSNFDSPADIRRLLNDGLSSSNLESVQRKNEVSRAIEAIKALAICHNVTPVTETSSTVEDDPGLEFGIEPQVMYQASSPDEIALVKWAMDAGLSLRRRDQGSMTLLVTDLGQSIHITILQIFPFMSDLKRMGIIVKEGEELTFYLKGADVVMKNVVRYNDWLDEAVGNMAREGLRTLVVAKRKLDQATYADFERRYAIAKSSQTNRSNQMTEAMVSLEMDMELIGVTGVEDTLQKDGQTAGTQPEAFEDSQVLHGFLQTAANLPDAFEEAQVLSIIEVDFQKLEKVVPMVESLHVRVEYLEKELEAMIRHAESDPCSNNGCESLREELKAIRAENTALKERNSILEKQLQKDPRSRKTGDSCKNQTDRFSCKQCGKSYQDGKSLVRHLNKHDEKYKCLYCQKTYDRQVNLTNHLQKPCQAK